MAKRLTHTAAQLDRAISKVLSDYADVSETTATAGDVLAGKVFVASDKTQTVGTLANTSLGVDVTFKLNGNDYTIASVPAGGRVNAPYVPEAIGGDLAGWSLTEDGSEYITFPYTPSVDTTLYAVMREVYYAIIVNIRNGSFSGAESIRKDGTAVVTLAADPNYVLPSTIEVTGVSPSDYTYNSTTGVISLSNPTGNVSITVVCEPSVTPQLATPTILLDGNTLSIEEITNAEYYDIYVDDTLEESIPASDAPNNSLLDRTGGYILDNTGGFITTTEV